jgi:hypothetical protein
MMLQGVQRIGTRLSLLIIASILSFFLIISSPDIEAQPESINVQNTVVTAPLTVVVPITTDVQNAQICVSAASSGEQSCTQMILDPEQNSYEAINVDLSDPASVPAVTSATPGVSKTITPPNERAPTINIQNTVVTQPLTVMIPIETNTQTAQICVTILSSGSQSCQQVVLDPETGMYTPVNVDLSLPTPVITPQETTPTSPTSNQPESINVGHTVATAPITVIVPITGNIQNAQICVSAGSSGTQSCTQLIVNPEQTSYSPVSADLTQSETPAVSSAVQQEPSPQIESTQSTTTTAGPSTTADSQQASQSPTSVTPETTTEPTMTEESPSSLPSEETESEGQPQGTSEEGEGSNSNTDEDATNGQ